MIGYIILGIIWLIISEVIYILSCKEETKKTIKEEWIFAKAFSLFGSFFITICIAGIYFAFKEYTKISIGITCGIVFMALFIYVNYKIGLRVAKKDEITKHKTKKRS